MIANTYKRQCVPNTALSSYRPHFANEKTQWLKKFIAQDYQPSMSQDLGSGLSTCFQPVHFDEYEF